MFGQQILPIIISMMSIREVSGAHLSPSHSNNYNRLGHVATLEGSGMSFGYYLVTLMDRICPLRTSSSTPSHFTKHSQYRFAQQVGFGHIVPCSGILLARID